MKLLTALPKVEHPVFIPLVQFPIALIMPFNPKMTSKQDLEAGIQRMQSRMEQELLLHYTMPEAMRTLGKIKKVLGNLNYGTHKKSVLILLPEQGEQILYMDMAVEERVVVDTPFRMRDLVGCKKNDMDYLVFLVSGKESKLFHGNGNGLTLIKNNKLHSIYAYINEKPERVANFSDPDKRREVVLDKFLHHMDEGLSVMLQSWPLPVIVIGSPRVAGHFARITHNEKHIAGYIHKSFAHADEKELMDWLQPYLHSWNQVRQQVALQQLEKAGKSGKLAWGISAVNKEAGYMNNRLLLIEKGLEGPIESGNGLNKDGIQDEVDRIIWKVLQHGGDIVWVEKNCLPAYEGIALIHS